MLITMPLDAAAKTFDHSDWDAVLAEFVDARGFVDYAALAKNRTQFDRYIKAIQTTSPDSDQSLFDGKDEELAYWMNAYNAQVFLGVLDWGTDIDSVWRGLISGRNFFVKRKVTVGGERMSLKALEDNIIRDRYQDARIHAAINCASIGCPRLPQTAFDGDLLNQQLDAAMTEFVNSDNHVQLDREDQTVNVSKIFDWFDGDFEREHGSVLSYINHYRTNKIPATYDVDHLPYDKGLNRQ